MTDLPAPLTPPECDLRGLPYMPLDVVRLFDSDFYILSSGDEFKAAVTLWGKAFLQVPAGSLPDNERVLAHLSGAGANWPTVRDMAMHGWVKCSDGRIYHPTVAEKALTAWSQRQAHRNRTEAATAARMAKRAQQDVTNGDSQNVADNVMPDVTSNVTRNVTNNVTLDVTNDDTLNVDSNTFRTKGREGKGIEEKKEPSPSAQDARGRRLPDTWQPTADDRAYAVRLGLDCNRIAEDFAGYWHSRPGEKARKTDWSLTWQGWCRRQAEDRPRGAIGKPKTILTLLGEEMRRDNTIEGTAA